MFTRGKGSEELRLIANDVPFRSTAIREDMVAHMIAAPV